MTPRSTLEAEADFDDGVDFEALEAERDDNEDLIDEDEFA